MSDDCRDLHALFGQLPTFAYPFDPGALPGNGIYVLYEIGEQGHGAERIVRVGSHTGKGQLPSRLGQHFLKENKDRSIFRKNIGRAILNRERDPFLDHWNLDLTTRVAKAEHAGRIDTRRQMEIEGQVTAFIRRAFQFVVIPIEDKEMRLRLESRITATVSLCHECGPSSLWLGHYSPVEKIRESGLWLVHGLYKTSVTMDDMAVIRSLAAVTGKRVPYVGQVLHT